MHLAETFYPEWLLLHLISSCIPWESNPWPWLCSTRLNIAHILTLVLSFSPVAERTGGNDPVLRSTLRDGANIPLAGCAGITKAEENNLHTTNEAYGRGLELTFLPSYPSFRESLIPSEHSCINELICGAFSRMWNDLLSLLGPWVS